MGHDPGGLPTNHKVDRANPPRVVRLLCNREVHPYAGFPERVDRRHETFIRGVDSWFDELAKAQGLNVEVAVMCRVHEHEHLSRRPRDCTP